jgi:secretion/DNA translocation related CpaE-like protein
MNPQGPSYGARDPVLITDDDNVAQLAGDIAAAAGAPLRILFPSREAPDHLRQESMATRLALVGRDCARVVVAARRDAVLVCTRDDPQLWQLAHDLGTRRVVVLPDGRAWLTNLLQRPATSVVLAVSGATGGIGASTLAAALAVALPNSWLVDADPMGAGSADVLGIALGASSWPEIISAAGELHPAALAASLPQVHGAKVVTWPPGVPQDLTLNDVGRVLAAGRAAAAWVVVDAGRRQPADATAVWRLVDQVVVLVGTAPRSVVAAAGQLHMLRAADVPATLVIRSARTGLAPAQIAECLGLSDVLLWPDLREVPEAADRGDLPHALRGRRVRRAVDAVLASVRSGPGAGDRPGVQQEAS